MLANKIIICEDDIAIRNRIKLVIEEVLMSMNLNLKIHEFPTYDRAEKFIYSSDYHSNNIFVLDIELGDDKTGINLGRELRTIDADSKIIYLSNHIDMSFDVFKYNLNIFDFVEKNNEFEIKFKESIKRCLSEITSETLEKKLNITSGNTIYSISMSEIIYIETLNKSKRLNLVTCDRMIEFSGSLNEIIEELDENFVLSHRANIVNVNSITELNLSYSSASILLKTGKRCLLSRGKIKEVRKIFEKT